MIQVACRNGDQMPHFDEFDEYGGKLKLQTGARHGTVEERDLVMSEDCESVTM